MSRYIIAENDVLRDELKAMRSAGRNIKKLISQTRMNPDIRKKIADELLWITDYYEAQKKLNQELYRQNDTE